MNVIRLYSEGSNDEEEYECNIEEERMGVYVIEDDLNDLIFNNNRRYVINFVFMDDARLNTSFKVLQLENDESIRRIAAEDAIMNSTNLWNIRKPYIIRKGTVLRIQFFKQVRSNNIEYCVTDITTNENLTKGNRIIQNVRFGTHIVMELPLRKSQELVTQPVHNLVLTLSEEAFADYLKSSLPLYNKNCPICFDCDYPLLFYTCGHVKCTKCEYRGKEVNISKDAYVDKCSYNCNFERKVNLKLRQTSCRFDSCGGSSNGVVLIPCGCYVPCENLWEEYNWKPNVETICVYKECQSVIDKMFKIFM